MIYRSRHTAGTTLHRSVVSAGILMLVVIGMLRESKPLHAQGDSASTIDEGFIQVEVMEVADRDMDVMIDSGELYLPFGEFFEFLNCKLTSSNDRQDLRVDLAEGHWFTISQITHKVVRDGDTIDFDPSMIYEASGEIYLKLPLVEQCLGIQMDYSFKELKLSIADYSILPIANMAHTRRGWQVLMEGEKTTEMKLETSLNRQLIGAVALDWNYNGSYFHNGPISEQENDGSIHLSMPFLFGILNTGGIGRYKTTETKPINFQHNGWTWDFFIPQYSLLSKITVSSPRKGHYALALTNTPLTPVRNLGTHDLIGYTQPKWLVEMYDKDKLVAEVIADSNGRYRFSIPVGYGSVHRRTVAIGPHSEKVVEEHDLEFNQRILTPGSIDYQANIAIDTLAPTTPISATINLRTGIFNWLGVGLNATLNLATMQSITKPGSRWYDTIAPTYIANLWLGGRTEANLAYDQKNAEISGGLNTLISRDIQLGLGVTGLRPTQGNVSSTLGINATTSIQLVSTSLNIGALYLRNDITVNPAIAGRIAGISGSVGTELLFSIRGSSTAGKVETNSAIPQNAPPRHLGFNTTRATLSFDLIRNAFLSTEAEFSHISNTFRSLTFRVNYALASELQVSLSYSVADYDWMRGAVRLGITMSTDLMQINVGGVKRGEAAYLGSVRLGGGMMFSSAGVQVRQNSLRGESMIRLQAFRDRNGDGVQDNDEEDLGPPEGTLTTELSSQPSIDGVFTRIPTTQEGRVIIDQYVFAGQDLYPSKRHFGIYPMPNSVSTINVPFREGYEVTGSCEVEYTRGDKTIRATKGVNGLRITLESTSGVGRFEGEIYNDGTLLVSGVAAGEYRLHLDSNQLNYRRLTLDQHYPEVIVVNDTKRELPLILLLTQAQDNASPPPSEQSR